MKGIEVNLLRSRQADLALDARVQEDAIEVGVCVDNPFKRGSVREKTQHILDFGGGVCLLLYKGIEASPVCDVVLDTACLVGAMFLDESVKSVLTTADSDDFGALEDELVSQCCTDSGGSADEKDAFVGRRHDCNWEDGKMV